MTALIIEGNGEMLEILAGSPKADFFLCDTFSKAVAILTIHPYVQDVYMAVQSVQGGYTARQFLTYCQEWGYNVHLTTTDPISAYDLSEEFGIPAIDKGDVLRRYA